MSGDILIKSNYVPNWDTNKSFPVYHKDPNHNEVIYMLSRGQCPFSGGPVRPIEIAHKIKELILFKNGDILIKL